MGVDNIVKLCSKLIWKYQTDHKFGKPRENVNIRHIKSLPKTPILSQSNLSPHLDLQATHTASRFPNDSIKCVVVVVSTSSQNRVKIHTRSDVFQKKGGNVF